jgi:hypothetical protein
MRNVTKDRNEAGQGAFVRRVLDRLQDDQNLMYLAARLRNYSELTETRIDGLRNAIEHEDSAGVESFAHALSDSTAKIGAIRMMKLCIALQMLGRRGLLKKASELFTELEQEYVVFKQNLIPNVG